ncbi:FecR domain-containing protein [Nitrospira sp. KM1]|uniref:FecR family protein n=1 Tax=Nitrospira sp. KM1 TaxID=1936990 RepID=UPI0015662A8F|nr:FecR domain-containing protein [Nitrospira sp. KM1]
MDSQSTSPEASDQRVPDAARHWIVRLASGNITESELTQFKQWLAESSTHQHAFDRERVFWQQLEPLKATVPGNAHHEHQTTSGKRRRHRWNIVIGGMVAAGFAGIVFYQDIRLLLLSDHRTSAGQQQIVTLPDGGTAHLNTDTAIAVSYTDNERRIELLKGEAFFQVVPNTQAPFRVAAQGGVTEAVGTAFAVHAQKQQAVVTVTEGVVNVTTHTARSGPPSTAVRKDQQTLYSPGEAPQPATAIDSHSAIAWTRGGIVIDKQPLAAAMAELDRYRPGRIVVLADLSRTKSVSGRFTLQGIDDAIAALAKTQGLRVVRVTDYLIFIL